MSLWSFLSTCPIQVLFLQVNWLSMMVTNLAHFQVRHFLWPSNAHAKVFMGKNTQLSNYFLTFFPGFLTVKKHCLNIWVVELLFGLKIGFFRTPSYIFRTPSRLSYFPNTCFHICICTSPYNNYATKVREPIYFLYLLPIYFDMVITLTPGAHPFGLLAIDL